jgi:two-component system, NarL family, response regulator
MKVPRTSTKRIRVLIADDHPVVREGLAAMIAAQSDMIVVGTAREGAEAIRLFLAKKPDVALVDLRMPGVDGVAAISTIRSAQPDARVLVLTTYDGDEDIYRALKAGAKAYLLKDVPREELLDAIRRVEAGGSYIPSAVASKFAARVTGPALTAREMDVLRLIVAGQANKEIAGLLSITEGTVKVHVAHILTKLGAADRTQAATSALKRGMVNDS